MHTLDRSENSIDSTVVVLIDRFIVAPLNINVLSSNTSVFVNIPLCEDWDKVLTAGSVCLLQKLLDRRSRTEQLLYDLVLERQTLDDLQTSYNTGTPLSKEQGIYSIDYS